MKWNHRMVAGVVGLIFAFVGYVHDSMLVNEIMRGNIPNVEPPDAFAQYGIWVVLGFMSIIMGIWGISRRNK